MSFVPTWKNLLIICLLLPVLVPVASTVIALDDLPQYTVGVQLGVAQHNAAGLKKPEGEVKLITGEEFTITVIQSIVY